MSVITSPRVTPTLGAYGGYGGVGTMGSFVAPAIGGTSGVFVW